MAAQPALYINPASGSLTRFIAADTLFIDKVQGIGAIGTVSIGDTAAGVVTVENDALIKGDLTVNGSASVAITANLNGNVNLGDGTGDIINLGGGGTDVVNLENDLVFGVAGPKLGSGIADYASEIWLATAEGTNTSGTSAAAYNLQASSAAAGAYAVGINPALLTNIGIPANTDDLMTVLDLMDAAIGGAAVADTLDGVINATVKDNNVTIPIGNEVIFSDGGAAAGDLLSVDRTFVGAGNAIAVSLVAGSTGSGLRVDTGSIGNNAVSLVSPQGTTDFNGGRITHDGSASFAITQADNAAAAGAAINVTSGKTTATGPGGALQLSAGAGGTVGGTGGQASLIGGAGSVAGGVGGPTIVKGGLGVGANAGGEASLLGGSAGLTGVGGAATVQGALGGATSGNGGLAQLVGGAAATDGRGGQIYIAAGASKLLNNGGLLDMEAGAAGTVGSGGGVNINAGAGGTISGTGGQVTINAGPATAGSTAGTIQIGRNNNTSQVLIGLAGASGVAVPVVLNPNSVAGSPAAVGGNIAVTLDDQAPQAEAGANAVGVYVGGFTNPTMAAANGDLQSVLEAVDTAVGTGNNLDGVMTGGAPDNAVTLDQTVAGQIWAVDDGGTNEAADAPLLKLTRSATLAPQEYVLNLTATAAVGVAAAGNALGITSTSGLIEAQTTSRNDNGFAVVMAPALASVSGNALSVEGNANFMSGGNRLIHVGEQGTANKVDFDHRGYTVTRVIATNYTVGAANQPTLNTGGVSMNFTGGDGNGTGFGGHARLTAGDGAPGGNIFVNSGSGVGAGAVGGNINIQVSDGDSGNAVDRGNILIDYALAITLGSGGAIVADYASPVTMYHALVAASPGAATRDANQLNVGGTLAAARLTSGANSVGVGTSALTNTLAAGLTTEIDLQQVLEFMDTAIGTAAGGTSLDATMTTAPIDNSVTIATGNEPVFTDSGNALAGSVFTVAKAGNSASPGFYVNGTGGTVGPVVQFDGNGGNVEFSIAADGSTRMGEDGASTASVSTDGAAGTAAITSADDKGITLTGPSVTVGRVSSIVVDSGIAKRIRIAHEETNATDEVNLSDGGIGISSTSISTETASTITMQSDAAAVGAKSGNVLIGSTNSVAGGTEAGVTINAGGLGFTAPAPGTVRVDASVDVAVNATAKMTSTVGANVISAFQVKAASDIFINLTTTTGSHTLDIGRAATTDLDTDIIAGTAGDLSLTARGASITINQAGDTVLDAAFAATSVVGALNELAAGALAFPTITVTANGTTAIVAKQLLSMANDAGTSAAFAADANVAAPTRYPVGFATAAAAISTSTEMQIAGEVTVPDALWDAAPVAADAGKHVFMSATAGNVTLTVPGSGSRSQRVGIVTFADASANTTRLVIQFGEGVDLP